MINFQPRAVRVVLLAATLAATTACHGVADERPQWIVTLDSDAPAPQIFDRLLVEVQSAQAAGCSGCSRVFGIADPSDLPVSFGIARSETLVANPRVRARLFRSAALAENGEPAARWTIDAIGQLPPAGAVVAVTMSLEMSCLGVASEVAAGRACDPDVAALAPIAQLGAAGALHETGSWPPAIEMPCPSDVPQDMVCIPGGAFVMGGELFNVAVPDLEGTPEQLVSLSPFAIDRDEVTVGTVRQLINQGLVGAPPPGNPDASHPFHFCTYVGADVADNDALPVSCVDRALAAAVCDKLGKRLPTEAEWEFAAGNRTRETPYPWGDGDDLCARAVVARGRTEFEAPGLFEATACRGDASATGPVAGGAATDITELGVRNMAGNLSEFVADSAVSYADDACWGASSPVLFDPLCQAPVGSNGLRGGSYAFGLEQADVRARDRVSDGFVVAGGFRCALSP